jgi:hypothetical protein
MSAEIKKEIQLEIAHVLFIDIVGYSKFSINEQGAAVDELTKVVRNGISSIRESFSSRPSSFAYFPEIFLCATGVGGCGCSLECMIDHQVCGLQVTMDDVRAIVRIIECVAKLTYPCSDLIGLENPLLFPRSQVR